MAVLERRREEKRTHHTTGLEGSKSLGVLDKRVEEPSPGLPSRMLSAYSRIRGMDKPQWDPYHRYMGSSKRAISFWASQIIKLGPS